MENAVLLKQNKKPFTDHQLTDVFTKVEECWQKYGSNVCDKPAHNSTITVTSLDRKEIHIRSKVRYISGI